MKLYRGVLEKPIVFPESIIITTENLDLIDFEKVVYCEMSSPGAMGNEGGILIYILRDEDTLVTYETNIKVDPQIYEIVSDMIDQNIDFFVQYPGSFGNYVYIKNGIQLEIDKKYNCFWYHSQNTKLRINSSVQGVFDSTVTEMTNQNSNNDQK